MNHKKVAVITTCGSKYHEKAVYTARALPEPIRWYTDDVDYVTELCATNGLSVEVVKGEWLKNLRANPYETALRNAGVSMVVFAMHHLIDEQKYDIAVAVDSDIQNLGGVEELLEQKHSHPVMVTNAASFQYPHEVQSPSMYGINGGVYVFDLNKLRDIKDKLPSYDDGYTTDEHYFNQLNCVERLYPTSRGYMGGKTLTGLVGRISTVYNFYVHDEFMSASDRKQCREMVEHAKVIHYMGDLSHDSEGILRARHTEFYDGFNTQDVFGHNEFNGFNDVEPTTEQKEAQFFAYIDMIMGGNGHDPAPWQAHEATGASDERHACGVSDFSECK